MRKTLINIFPYKFKSRSVRALSKAIPAYRINPKRDRFIGNRGIVVNWGATEISEHLLDEATYLGIINHPNNVRIASNKLLFFETISHLGILPRWTTDIDEAKVWIKGKHIVLCRTILSGHSGNGIVLANVEEELVESPLYVRYIGKQDEFRVHVFNGEVIDVQRKARSRDIPDERINWQIRTHNNGFIFARERIMEVPYLNHLKELSLQVVDETGLHFGAVDLIYNGNGDRLYVLEVNTAPGLEGTTLERYVEAIRRVG